jgi:pimeloyl-ACP methyl ester carboxylesterase
VPGVRSAALSTGVTLPYAEQGDPAGVPVLLLHGYADSRRFFDPLLAQLTPDVHAFAPDQRGHGDAGRPESGYAPEDFAADAAAFMDAELCPRSGQEALAAAIPGAELVTYAGAGHAVACELPARTAADLTAFARRLR